MVRTTSHHYDVMLVGLLFSFCMHSYAATDDDASCEADSGAEVSNFIRNGGFLLLVLACIISLWALAFVCEDFFVPALQVLCKRWKVPDSVAGSLIMAAGNNAPEMFVSFLGIFIQKSAIGIGTVIGSEIFNHMIISAGSGYFAKGGVLQLNKYQFTRDCFAYLVSLFVFMWSTGADYKHTFMRNQWGHCLRITMISAAVLVGCQLLYCMLVAKFLDILKFLGIEEEEVRLTVRLTTCGCGYDGVDRPTLSSIRASTKARLLDRNMSGPGSDDDDDEEEDIRMTNRDTITIYNEIKEKSLGFGDEYDAGIMMTLSNVCTYILLPFKLTIEYTIPNVTFEKWENFYGLAILICICWLGVFAYALCECLTVLGEWLQIPAVVMGLTFSAIGTSFPNLWCSLVVARNGQGDMAVSNALGSNTFNINVALGLPWLVYTAVNKDSYDKLQDGGIIYLSLMLITVLAFYYIMIIAYGWRIYAWMWPYMTIAYIGVIVVCCTVTKT